MLAAAIVVFREIVEAGLIVGIVLAVTRGVPGRSYWVALGIGAGVAGSCVAAAFTGVLANAFEGAGQEVFAACLQGLAALMLAWHNIWMSRHGREMAAELRDSGRAVASGSRSLPALAVVVGVAVLREGAEVVLFLYGVAMSEGAGSGASVGLGAAAGLLLGALVSAVTYLGLVAIPARAIFSATSGLLILLSAGLAAQAIAFLERAGWIEVLGQVAWDSSNILSESSPVGRILHTLVGYSDQPTALQVLVYALMIAGVTIISKALPAAGGRTQAQTAQ